MHKVGTVLLIQRLSTIVLIFGLMVFFMAGCKGRDTGSKPGDSIQDNLLPKGAIEFMRTVQERDGKTYTSVKYNMPDGTQGVLIIDGKGVPIKRMPVLIRSIIGPNLRELLSHPKGHELYIAPRDRVEVVVVLVDKMTRYDGPMSVIEVEVGEKGEQSILIDGKSATAKALAKLQAQRLSAADVARKTRLSQRQARMRRLVKQNGWKDEVSLQAVKEGRTSLRHKLTRSELETLSKSADELIVSIELFEPDFDELTSAMAATNTQDWAIDRGHDGSGSGIYMREANGDACPSAANMNSGLYTNISATGSSSHANKVGNIIATVAPKAHVYCGTTDFMSNPGSRNPRPWVANHSWGSGTDTVYKSRDRDFDDGIYDDDWTVVKSAGNTSGNVTSPGKAFNIITVGNYIDSSTTMSGSSAFIDPDTNADKPDLSAPGSVSTSAGNCSGTSCAAPHATGFAADLMGKYSWLEGQPARIKSLMMAGATDNIEGSARYSDKDGAGGIEYLNSGYNGVNTVWWGGNGSHFDSSNRVRATRTFTANQRYRVALVWLVPGTFAYSPTSYHAHSYYITMDLDLKIIDPSGHTVAGSYSWDNAFEIVDFVAPGTGTYTIEIRRYANSGNGKINMAMHSQRVL